MFHHSPFQEATPAQLDCLQKMGVTILNHCLSRYQADQLIGQHRERWEALPPSSRQKNFLRMKGRWREGMGAARRRS